MKVRFREFLRETPQARIAVAAVAAASNAATTAITYMADDLNFFLDPVTNKTYALDEHILSFLAPDLIAKISREKYYLSESDISTVKQKLHEKEAYPFVVSFIAEPSKQAFILHYFNATLQSFSSVNLQSILKKATYSNGVGYYKTIKMDTDGPDSAEDLLAMKFLRVLFTGYSGSYNVDLLQGIDDSTLQQMNLDGGSFLDLELSRIQDVDENPALVASTAADLPDSQFLPMAPIHTGRMFRLFRQVFCCGEVDTQSKDYQLLSRNSSRL